jgi:hypothetical protein
MQCRHSHFPLLVAVIVILAFINSPSHAGVIVRQQNSTYVLLETSYMMFELNNDTWYFTVKLPKGNVGAGVGSRLIGFDHKVRFRHNMEPCVEVARLYPVVNLTTRHVPLRKLASAIRNSVLRANHVMLWIVLCLAQLERSLKSF